MIYERYKDIRDFLNAIQMTNVLTNIKSQLKFIELSDYWLSSLVFHNGTNFNVKYSKKRDEIIVSFSFVSYRNINTWLNNVLNGKFQNKYQVKLKTSSRNYFYYIKLNKESDYNDINNIYLYYCEIVNLIKNKITAC
jgi:hypothetical protein